MMDVFKLRVLSLNVWGVPVIGRHTTERIDAIIEHVASSDSYDLICFQEVFVNDVWERLESQLATLAGLKYSFRFVNGADLPGQACGAGVAIFSRYPILDTAFYPFAASGRPHRVDQFDWQAGKGVGLARVLLPGDYGTADVYCTHFVAQYLDGEADEYAGQRVLQALDAAMFIRSTRRSDLTLLCGDLNAGPDSLVYTLLSTLAGLKDAYSTTHTSEEKLAALRHELHFNGSASGTARKRLTAGPEGSATPAPAPGASTPRRDIRDSTKSAGGSTLTGLRDTAGPSRTGTLLSRSIYDATFGDGENAFTKTALNNSAVVMQRIGKALAAIGLAAQTETPACDENARLDYVLFGCGSSAWPFAPMSSGLPSYPHTTRAWHILASDIRMKEPIQVGGRTGPMINVSDHSGVYAEFGCLLLKALLGGGSTFSPAPLRTPANSTRTHRPSSSASALASARTVGVSGAASRVRTQRTMESSLLAADGGDNEEDGQASAAAGTTDPERSVDATEAEADPPEGELSITGGLIVQDVLGHLHSMSSLVSPSDSGPAVGSSTHADVVGGGVGSLLSSPSMHHMHHPSPYMAQALDAASAALQVAGRASSALSPGGGGRAAGLLSASAGEEEDEATLMHRAWRPVLREGLAKLEQGLAVARQERVGTLNAAVRNILLSMVLLVVCMFTSSEGSGHDAVHGVMAAVAATAGLTFSFLALMRIKNRLMMIYVVCAVALFCGVFMATSLWAGGLRGLAAAAAVALVVLATVQTITGLTALPAEVRAFERGMGQLRILLQRPPAVVA